MKNVDGRDKPGHDEAESFAPPIHLVMPALVAGIHVLSRKFKNVDGRDDARP
jgi:hypothetical protein